MLCITVYQWFVPLPIRSAAKKYPFYGVQWHPEKNGFEWNRRESINHSWDAVMAMQKAANFFVNEGVIIMIANYACLN